MITTTLDTTGLDHMLAGSDQAADLAAYRTSVDEAQIARQLVHVRTGYTKSTIAIEPVPGGYEVVAGGAALPLELGFHDRNGKYHGPWPFLIPAYTAAVPRLPKYLADYYYLLMTGQGLPSKASLGK